MLLSVEPSTSPLHLGTGAGPYVDGDLVGWRSRERSSSVCVMQNVYLRIFNRSASTKDTLLGLIRNQTWDLRDDQCKISVHLSVYCTNTDQEYSYLLMNMLTSI
jgi:hypothetical protein